MGNLKLDLSVNKLISFKFFNPTYQLPVCKSQFLHAFIQHMFIKWLLIASDHIKSRAVQVGKEWFLPLRSQYTWEGRTIKKEFSVGGNS